MVNVEMNYTAMITSENLKAECEALRRKFKGVILFDPSCHMNGNAKRIVDHKGEPLAALVVP